MVRSAVAVSTVLDTASLGEALAKMIKNHMQQLLVINQKGEYLGELTTFTLAKLLLPADASRPQTTQEAEDETAIDVDDRIAPYLGRRIGDFAEHDVPVMRPDTPLVEAIKHLAQGRLRLPVVDPESNKLVGVISSLTVLRRYQF
jgi:CBS domain-containing protein